MFQKIINKLNDLRPKQLLMLAVVAGGLMFVTIFVGIRMMTNKEVVIMPEEKPQPIVEMTSVVVAKLNIHPRTIIQENMLQMKELPAELVPEGAIRNFSEVQGVQVKVSIFAGDVLTVQKVFSESSDEGFAGTIPADCRAVSISVNDLTGVAGFAKPGDHVDLLLVEKGQYSATTNILLQNVPLLSVNQDSTGAPPVGENGVPKTTITNPTIATFALPPEDVLKLISATRLGEIYMMLRPPNPQHTYVGAMEYTIESINAPKPAPAPAPVTVPAIPANPVPAQVPVMPTTPKIEIIQGDKIIKDDAPVITQPAQNTGAGGPTTVLPIIPSRTVPTFFPPPVSETPSASPPIVEPPSDN